jgi:hypothetical protein
MAMVLLSKDVKIYCTTKRWFCNSTSRIYNYLGITSSSAHSITSTAGFRIAQNIEGFNTADLAMGYSQC